MYFTIKNGDFMQNRLLRAADGVVLWLSILLFGFLTVASMLSTAYFTPNSSYAERPEYRWDLIPLNLLFLAAVVGILYILYKKQIFEKISTKALAAIAVLFVIGIPTRRPIRKRFPGYPT